MVIVVLLFRYRCSSGTRASQQRVNGLILGQPGEHAAAQATVDKALTGLLIPVVQFREHPTAYGTADEALAGLLVVVEQFAEQATAQAAL
jgi:hypothetical protein